jgi:TRAP-type C4-dicarboxylate transport system permease small subunit
MSEGEPTDIGSPWRYVQLVWQGLLAATMAAMVVAVALGVVSRAFGRPLYWTEEVSRFALIWMSFLGAAELFRRKLGHIAVTFVLDASPVWLRRSLEVVGNAVVVAVLAAMVIGGITFANPSRPAVSAALGVPSWTMYAVVPFSGALSLIFLARSWFRRTPQAGGE